MPEDTQLQRTLAQLPDLPGVVADQYGDTVVVQIQTLAMEKRSALLSDLLDRVLAPAEIVFRNDAPIRRLEGLAQEDLDHLANTLVETIRKRFGTVFVPVEDFADVPGAPRRARRSMRGRDSSGPRTPRHRRSRRRR